MRFFSSDHLQTLLSFTLLPTLSSTSVLPPSAPDLASSASNPQHPLTHSPKPPSVPAKPLPLLIWHGLGDRFDADGLHSVGELAQQIHPGTYVHYISTAGPDESGSADRTASFFGNVSVQIEEVCEVLKADPRLWRRDPQSQPQSQSGSRSEEEEEDDIFGEGHELRVDALGFSQGGQFLRGLLQRCEPLSIRSLVTFGSQHNGISQFQHCGTWDFVCKGASALVQGNVWTDTVQSRVVPAQYFREVNETTGFGAEGYLENSHFLADVNNERSSSGGKSDSSSSSHAVDRSKEYKEKVQSLENFVMFIFEEDTTVIPKESGWFADVNITSGEITPLRNRTLYKEDWLGLKALDESGGLFFKNTPGRHMALDEDVLSSTFSEFFGPEASEKIVVEGSAVWFGGFATTRKVALGWLGRVWTGFWAWIDNGAMVAPPQFAVNVAGVPKEVL